MLLTRFFLLKIIIPCVAFIPGALLIQFPNELCWTCKNILNNETNPKQYHGNEKVISTITKTSNGTSNIEEILENTRRQIRTELRHYNFSKSGANKLEDLVSETGGKPLITVIVSTWRSGSSFLGEILSVNPGTLYQYEPLLHYGIIQIRGPPHSNNCTRFLTNILKCNYDEDLRDYFTEYDRKIQEYIFYKYRNRGAYCKFEDFCLDAKYLARVWMLFPFHTMKLVRFRLQLLENILKDEELNLKVVLLIRDPRGVMQSRSYCDFCRVPDCSDPNLVCSDMVSDYMAATRFLVRYPNRLVVVRYEDLTLNPKSTSYKLYDFLGLDVTPSLDKYLETHTTTQDTFRSSKYRASRDNAFKWKGRLDFDFGSRIQMSCKEAMRLWGYRMADNATHMQSKEFNPIYDYTVETFA